MTILRPNFWAGRSSETVGRRGPRTSPKVSPIIRGTRGAQSSNLILQKNLPSTPPPPPLNAFLSQKKKPTKEEKDALALEKKLQRLEFEKKKEAGSQEDKADKQPES